MSTAVKRKLSAAAAGNTGIEITTTSTAGDLIHSAVAGTTAGTFDEIWLWAQNNYTADVILTVEFGSHDHAQNITLTIPFKSGLVPVVPGLPLQNTLDVNAFAGTPNVITLFGFINLITD
jgi:ABC-type Fe3+ transport system substrate-binding protein